MGLALTLSQTLTARHSHGLRLNILAPIFPLCALCIVSIAIVTRPPQDRARPYTLLAAASLLAIGTSQVSPRAPDAVLIDRLHSYTPYTYIHFRSDGTGSAPRHTGATAKSHDAVASLPNTPHSAYRPAVILKLAQSQYEQWDFSGATFHVRPAHREYPRFAANAIS